MTESLSLIRYEAARAALAEAVSVDEVQEVRGAARQIKAYARIAKDKRLMADAASLQMRAERKLGVLIRSAMETGQLGIGRPAKSNVIGTPDPDQENGSSEEPFTRTTLSEAGIDKKLSMKAQTWARMGDDEFDAKLAEVRDKIESSGAAVINPQKDFSTADKKLRRETRERELGAKQQALPDRRYGVIYADPEWRFEPYSRTTGMDRAADNHYPTSALDDIKARPVGDIAAPDCVLFLWATAPMLPQALEVMAAWGFTYKSQVVWIKQRAGDGRGTGYWFINEHEVLLVGTSGEVPAPAPGSQWRSYVTAPVEEHSAKPDIFALLIEAYFPSLPKIELNARRRRDGWEAWGLEAPDATSAAPPPPLTPPLKGEGDTPLSDRIPAGSHADDDRQPVQASASADRLTGEGLEATTREGLANPGAVASASDQPIRRDDLVDAAGGDPNTPPAGAVAAEPETGADQSGALGGGEGGAGAGGVLPDPSALYQAAVAAGAEFAGRHTQATIEPILRAGVAAQVTGAQMAMDTDSKLGSILGWKAKLKLTGLGSGRAAPRPRVQEAAE